MSRGDADVDAQHTGTEMDTAEHAALADIRADTEQVLLIEMIELGLGAPETASPHQMQANREFAMAALRHTGEMNPIADSAPTPTPVNTGTVAEIEMGMKSTEVGCDSHSSTDTTVHVNTDQDTDTDTDTATMDNATSLAADHALAPVHMPPKVAAAPGPKVAHDSKPDGSTDALND